MKRAVSEIIRWTGHVFTIVAAILFYIHLFTAALYGEFVVKVYFNYFGEGLIELIIFTIVLPFIAFSGIMQLKETYKSLKRRKENEDRSRYFDRN